MLTERADDYPLHYATITFTSPSEVELIAYCLRHCIIEAFDSDVLDTDDFFIALRIAGVLDNVLTECVDNESNDS